MDNWNDHAFTYNKAMLEKHRCCKRVMIELRNCMIAMEAMTNAEENRTVVGKGKICPNTVAAAAATSERGLT